MLLLSRTRIFAAGGVILLIAIDVVYHAQIGKFMASSPVGGIVSCAVAAFVFAVLLQSLITEKFSIDTTDQRWMALVLFVALLLRYSLVSFFQLTPSFLLLIGLIVSIVGLCRLYRPDPGADPRKRDLTLTMRMLLLGLLFGLYLILSATGYAPKENAYTVERTAMGWALAYFAASFLVGFLFAYPRTLQGDAAEKSPYEQRVNTNLEQISDWLTKIIVGLGLVELKAIPGKLAAASKWMAQSFAWTGAPSDALVSFCGGFIIFFAVLGFLAGHLSTRMFLSPAFYRGDQREKVFIDQQVAAPDVTAKRYLSFITDKQNADKVDAWLTKIGKPEVKASDIVAGFQFADLRKQALDELDKS